VRAKIFFCSHHRLLASCVRFSSRQSVPHALPASASLFCPAVASVESQNASLANWVWTSPCISTGANVQKRRHSLPPEICTPSVQAGYTACPAHRHARKPLSLWRKSGLSTVNGAFTTTTIFYVYLLIKQITDRRCEKPGCARSWPGDKPDFVD